MWQRKALKRTSTSALHPWKCYTLANSNKGHLCFFKNFIFISLQLFIIYVNNIDPVLQNSGEVEFLNLYY